MDYKTSFDRSSTIVNISSALVVAWAEMPVIPFDSKNPFLHNEYAGLGSVIEKTRPVLAQHNLAIIQFPIYGEGTVTREGLIEAAKGEPSPGTEKTTRSGAVDVGVQTILMHSSGEWISQSILVAMSKEKGKSVAQMAGSVITYLRRYAWISVLGLYAERDTDGGEGGGGEDYGGGRSRGGNDPGESWDSARGNKPSSTAQTPQASQAASTSPPPGVPAPTGRDAWLAAIRKHITKETYPGFLHYLRNAKTGPNNDLAPRLAANQDVKDLRSDWLEYYAGNLPSEMPKIDIWLSENPMPAASPAPAGAVNVPRDPEPANPEEWRTFKMPFGQNEGIDLANLDKKYLFGLWANWTPKTEWQGKPLSSDRLAIDKKFRQMLDAAGQHYEFKK